METLIIICVAIVSSSMCSADSALRYLDSSLCSFLFFRFDMKSCTKKCLSIIMFCVRYYEFVLLHHDLQKYVVHGRGNLLVHSATTRVNLQKNLIFHFIEINIYII